MQDQLVIVPATGANPKKATGIAPPRSWAASRRQKIEALDGELQRFREGNVRLVAQLQPLRSQQFLTMAHDWIGDNDLMRGLHVTDAEYRTKGHIRRKT